jgi:MFS family permease
LGAATDKAGAEAAVFAKAAWRVIPLLFICYVAAFLDRVNVGFAKLQMAADLGLSDAVYGAGAGVFFFGYFLFEVPSNVILARIGARVWITRIMITWALVSGAFMFAQVLHWGPLAHAAGLSDAQFTFYALRFLLGVAEAGFFPGVILYLTYWFPATRRAQSAALFMSAIAVSNVVGSPLSGAIMQWLDGAGALRGWQWLFLIEAIPSLLMGFVVFALLPDGPAQARWLNAEEKALIATRLSEDEDARRLLGARRAFAECFTDVRVWALAAVYFCNNVCFYAVNFWMPTIIQEIGVREGDYLRVGLIAVIPWGAMAVAQILWAHHSDRTGERRWHAAGGLFLAMAGLVALAFVGHAPVASIAALTCVTVGLGCFFTVFWSLPTAFLSGAAAAGGIAWINSLGNLGGFFGPDLIGRVRMAAGGANEAAFFALAAAALIGALIVLALPKARRATSDAG